MTYRPQPSDLSISFAARSEAGPCRDRNEDTFQIIDLARGTSFGPPAAPGRLAGSAFVLGVYDGCGYGRAGVASDLAAAEVQARVRRPPLPMIAEELVQSRAGGGS